MQRLAPTGMFPGRQGLIGRALAGLLDGRELRVEIERQLDRFEQGLGFAPDHIDGHEHAHVLPGVRGALMDAVARRYRERPPLIRSPADRPDAIVARRVAAGKALSVGALALGFAGRARRRGLPINDSFAGFSDFDVEEPYAEELARAFLRPGRRHLVMCHPGHPDAELARIDPVVARRHMEYETLLRDPHLPERIWRPSRPADGPPIAWRDLPG